MYMCLGAEERMTKHSHTAKSTVSTKVLMNHYKIEKWI